MRARYYLPALFAALLLSLGALPVVAVAQSDDSDEPNASAAASADADTDDSASAGAESEDAAGEYGDSEPSVDEDAELDEDEDAELDADDEALDSDDMGNGSAGAAGAMTAQDAVDEEARTETGVFSGKLSIAVFGGYGLRLAGDKSINPFSVGLSPENNSLNLGGAPVDPTMMVMPPPPTVFDRAQAVMDSYSRRMLGLEPKANPFGTSFGARIGYTLPKDPLYIGVLFNYFSGGKLTVPAVNIPATDFTPAEINPTIVSTTRVLLIGVEGGLDWDLAEFLVVRPALGVGAGLASTKLCLNGEQVTDANGVTMTQNACESVSNTRVYLMPGLSVIVPIDMFFVAGEGRFIGLSGAGGQASFYLGGNAGIALAL